VLLVAKHREAATALHMQFQNRSVRKTYLAIACGVPSEATFGVDAPVDRHDTIKCALVVGCNSLLGALASGPCRGAVDCCQWSFGSLCCCPELFRSDWHGMGFALALIRI